MTNDTMNKKYKLKPGLHQFIPGSAAQHHNGNFSDDEAEWYLKKYPHIAALFEITPGVITIDEQKETIDNSITQLFKD